MADFPNTFPFCKAEEVDWEKLSLFTLLQLEMTRSKDVPKDLLDRAGMELDKRLSGIEDSYTQLKPAPGIYRVAIQSRFHLAGETVLVHIKEGSAFDTFPSALHNMGYQEDRFTYLVLSKVE